MLAKLDLKKKVRERYPMTWEEQSILFGELPAHLQAMALFKVNTGTREQEVCKLRWCELAADLAPSRSLQEILS